MPTIFASISISVINSAASLTPTYYQLATCYLLIEMLPHMTTLVISPFAVVCWLFPYLNFKVFQLRSYHDH